jgi:hypothetical protein
MSFNIFDYSGFIWLGVIILGTLFLGYKFVIGLIVGIFYLAYLVLNSDLISGLLTKKVNAESMLSSVLGGKTK